MEDMSSLKHLKERLINALCTELSKDLTTVDTHEAYEAADIIKDLAQTEKLCCEAEYYKKVTEAMETKKRPYVDQEPYIESYLNERMGYPMPRSSPPNVDWHNDPNSSRYGNAYQEYREARRHYTVTNSAKDHDEMNMHATEHLGDMMATMREIWKTSDQDLRVRIKNDLTNLLGEMK